MELKGNVKSIEYESLIVCMTLCVYIYRNMEEVPKCCGTIFLAFVLL